MELTLEACLGISQQDTGRCIFLGRENNVSKGLDPGDSWRVWELYVLGPCWSFTPVVASDGGGLVVA